MSWLPQAIYKKLQNEEPQCLLFSACQEGAGATRCLMEAALDLHRNYPLLKVLLVDFRSANKTLSNMLVQGGGWKSCMRAVGGMPTIATPLAGDYDGLFLLPVGKGTDVQKMNAEDVNETFRKIRSECLPEFDLILADIDPVLPERRGSVIYPQSDGVVLVVEAGQTRRPIIEEAIRTVNEFGGVITGVMLNRRQKLIPQWIYRRFF